MVFKIGEFSRVSRVPVKTLRYYDEIGLLRPAMVDPFTSYRYYSAEQLARLNRILVLKDLGFPLEQVGQMLDDGLSAEQIKGMMRLRQAESAQRVEEEQARLARIEARLRQIEMEGRMPEYEVVLKSLPAMQVAALRDTCQTYAGMGPLFEEVFATLGAAQRAPGGPPMVVFHDEGFRAENVDVEVLAPLGPGGPLPAGSRVKERQVEPIEVAALLYVGSYENFGAAYEALMRWVEANGYQLSGPTREVYLRGPESGPDSSQYLTEIQFPVQRKV